jgi:hypothetical protein
MLHFFGNQKHVALCWTDDVMCRLFQEQNGTISVKSAYILMKHNLSLSCRVEVLTLFFLKMEVVEIQNIKL